MTEGEAVRFLTDKGSNVNAHKMIVTIQQQSDIQDEVKKVIYLLSKKFGYAVTDNKLKLVQYNRIKFNKPY